MGRRAVAIGAVVIAALVAIAVVVTVVQPTAPRSYVVVRGDTLFEIARAHEVTVEELRAWNGIVGDRIDVGQVLVLHRGARAPTAAPATRPAPRRAPRGGTDGATPALEMPAAQPCRAPPSLEGGADEEMAASAGLSRDQVRAAMDAFVHHTLRCLGDGSSGPREALDLDITVGCDGRVAGIAVIDAGDWPDGVAACVTETLRFTPFPAHDLPDGDSFRYPLRYTPG